ncbi:MAG TPA: hypothetical protein PLZ51_27775, partial [Aggregatilineales bacterium]|nr:hypothetical protein [Aggregatilineales bacterium]
ENTQQTYLATLNPLPVVINTNLPTQESLNLGEKAFNEHCEAWHNTSDFDELVARLNRTRDEDLYSALVDGWRNLPACAREL